MAPDGATFTLVKLTGTATDVDDDILNANDGLWLLLDGARDNTSALASFGTPTVPPSGTQTFRVRVRKDDVGTSTPTVTMSLYENGILRQTGPVNTITSDDLANGMVFTWSLPSIETLLANGDGSGVELFVEGTAAGAGGGMRTVEIGAIEWMATSP
jgi:hypothetical protein